MNDSREQQDARRKESKELEPTDKDTGYEAATP